MPDTQNKPHEPVESLFGAVDAPGRFSPVYAAYVRLIERAVDVFGSERAANHWLTTPQPYFHDQVPLDMAAVHGYSADVFEDYFGRIEHGIYS